MKSFTTQRDADTRDEIWLVQHPPVYTQGQAGKPEHLLHTTPTPVVKIDRGGQITYHGPGQIVMYLLLDLRRWGLNVRQLVRLMEQSVIDLLASYGVAAQGRADAPGVYVGNAKIAALGLKIRNGCCYHGLSFNVDMDLSPFDYINPCGYPGLRVTQARDLGIATPLPQLEQQLAGNLIALLQTGVGAAVGRDHAACAELSLQTGVGAAVGRDQTQSRPTAAPTQAETPGHLALRKGRTSIPNQVYLVTTTTANRQKFFGGYAEGCIAVRCFEDAQLLGDARMLAWVLMPDHVHWLLQLGEKNDLGTVVRRLKSASTLQLNRKLGRKGDLWAKAFHDHALRADEDVQDVARYIVANPLRAGLVEHIGDYPFWNAIWLQERSLAATGISRPTAAPAGN
jgi:lipoyl(octanoyl) transferase